MGPLEFDTKQNNADALAYVRRQSLDTFNRLRSILEDVHFVRQVHQAYPELPILPNLRCGAWYVDPEIASDEPAYFKSTDGHFGNWTFNLRRPNLHLLPVIIARSGLVLVDSTRAGKRIPDALSKTVPIWCAVINRAMELTHPDIKQDDWDVDLYCPPGSVSEQERSQMKLRLNEWAESLANSSYRLPRLPRPLRPLWITPATSLFPSLQSGCQMEYLPLICVSASKQVHDGIERRLHGFAYVQGSGDDHELWGMGLTPQLFWKHKEELMDSDRDDLTSVISTLVQQATIRSFADSWSTLPTPISAVHGRLLVGSVSDMPSSPNHSIPHFDGPVSFVVVSADTPITETGSDSDTDLDSPSLSHILRLRLAEGKKDQLHFLQHVLPTSTRYIKDCLARGDAVCVCCDSGRDASVGIALAALQMFFDDDGKMIEDGAQVHTSKASIRTRLQWIIASRPQANPSRVTLKRVNEFLLSSPAFRRR